jgi:hypothetical protein
MSAFKLGLAGLVGAIVALATIAVTYYFITKDSYVQIINLSGESIRASITDGEEDLWLADISPGQALETSLNVHRESTLSIKFVSRGTTLEEPLGYASPGLPIRYQITFSEHGARLVSQCLRRML